MSRTPHMLVAGELPGRLQAATAHGLACGALRSIDTRSISVEDGGLRFRIRQVASLRHKQQAREAEARLREAGRRDVNPFLPHDPDLYVGQLGAAHLVLLNKFNVVDRHLLVVTRDFEPQQRLLGVTDLAALLWCLREIDGLGFYNGGSEAGASQPHKHLQLVPLPLAEDGPPLPVAALLAAPGDAPAHSPALPFRHAYQACPPLPAGDLGAAAEHAHAAYLQLLEAAGLPIDDPAGDQPGPYNLLVTRELMLVVPRRQEHVDGISLNALGYAGSLLVRDDAQLERLRALGPMTALARAAHALA